jgi:hypothetical protein
MHDYGTKMTKKSQSTRSRLTEENLRLHSTFHVKVRQSTHHRRSATNSHLQAPREAALQPVQVKARTRVSVYDHAYDDCIESDDEDLEAIRNVELRRAASLEALQAYGGCFVSGFMAMQEPLPGRYTTARSASKLSTSTSSADSPRPDSDTLSHMDVRELSERGRSCKSRRKMRSAGHKSRW